MAAATSALMHAIRVLAAMTAFAPPIIRGDIEPGQPTVVGLATGLGFPMCTGTLVSPRVVLTARHCVNIVELAFFGTDPSSDGVFVAIDARVSHPSLDLGLVHLTRGAPIPPSPISRAPLATTDLGRTLFFVGFGYDVAGNADTYGVKRSATATLDTFDATTLEASNVTCNGDSGGPVFADGLIAGVNSMGTRSCSGQDVSVRVDVAADWVDASVAALDPPGCGLDQRCVATCDSDPDCALEAP